MHGPVYEVNARAYSTATMLDTTPTFQSIAKKLQTAGFIVSVETYTQQVGGGFKSLDAESHEENAARIKICW